MTISPDIYESSRYPCIGFQNEELEQGLVANGSAAACCRHLPMAYPFTSCRRHWVTFSVRVTIKFAEPILTVTRASLLPLDARLMKMILPQLRTDLEFMPSPVTGRPGLLIRDRFRYSDATLIIPPPLIPGLLLFDGTRTDLDLQRELTRSLGSPEIGSAAGHLLEALSQAGFLEDETYVNLKQGRILAFTESPVRPAAHAGSAYPAEIGPLRNLMHQYLEGAVPAQQGVMGIAAPHVSPRAAGKATGLLIKN